MRSCKGSAVRTKGKKSKGENVIKKQKSKKSQKKKKNRYNKRKKLSFAFGKIIIFKAFFSVIDPV